MQDNEKHEAVVIKSLDGRITLWTPGAEAMFGYTAAQAMGKHISIIIPFDYQDEEYDILDRIKLDRRPVSCATVRRSRDGVLLRVKMHVSPECGEDGKICAIRNEFRLIQAPAKPAQAEKA